VYNTATRDNHGASRARISALALYVVSDRRWQVTFFSCGRSFRFAYALPIALAATLFTAPAGYTQTASLANINGIVTDESGGVLPGVTVTASSPSLQIKQVSTVTEDSGEYRLSGLPLGTYEVVYSLDGFQSIRRQDVRLTAGFTAKLDITLKVGALNETITTETPVRTVC
jgi:hypothetical protein